MEKYDLSNSFSNNDLAKASSSFSNKKKPIAVQKTSAGFDPSAYYYRGANKDKKAFASNARQNYTLDGNARPGISDYGQASSVIPAQVSAPAVSSFAGGESMLNSQGQHVLDNGSADGEFTWYNPADYGRDFGDNRAVDTLNYGPDGKTELSATNKKLNAEAAYLDKLANPGFDWTGAANVGLGALDTGLNLYSYFSDGGQRDMQKEQLGALQDNREYARSAFDDRQAFRKGASGGFNRASAVV